MARTYSSGCSSDELRITDDGRYLKNGQRITEPHWPQAVEQFEGLINEAAQKHDVAPALIAGVIAGESRGRPTVVSPVGASGLMQLMPQYFGGNANGRLFDPATNIDLGTKFLSQLDEKYQGNPLLMLSAYNSGSPQCRSLEWGLRQNVGYISKCLGYANDAADLGFSPFKPSVAPAGIGMNWPVILLLGAGLAYALNWMSEASTIAVEGADA